MPITLGLFYYPSRLNKIAVHARLSHWVQIDKQPNWNSTVVVNSPHLIINFGILRTAIYRLAIFHSY